MWKEKLGNYLIDVSKYFLTGVFVTSLIKDLAEMRWFIYIKWKCCHHLVVIGIDFDK